MTDVGVSRSVTGARRPAPPPPGRYLPQGPSDYIRACAGWAYPSRAVSGRRKGRAHVGKSATDYVWAGATGPFALRLDAGVFTPSHTTRVLGDTMQIRAGETVLDVGCGSGVLSLVAARLGAGRVVGTDAFASSARCARANAETLGLGDVTDFRTGHLFESVRDVRADVIVADVTGVPDAIAGVSGWFPAGHGGGPTGAELPMEMLQEIGDRLAAGGRVYLPTGTIQDEDAVLAVARRVFTGGMTPVATREFPLPEAVVSTREVTALIASGILKLGSRGSRRTWRLTVWRAML